MKNSSTIETTHALLYFKSIPFRKQYKYTKNSLFFIATIFSSSSEAKTAVKTSFQVGHRNRRRYQ
jgi:hypothetical protein